MSDLSCKLLVIGAGPGGYVCAIRAGQLGVETIIVDPRPPGGTCLNIGCIPSKALIHAAEEFWRAGHLDAGPLGITAGRPEIDLSRTVAWKDGIVQRLNGGVAGLLKKAKVRLVTGRARFLDGKTVEAEGPEGRQKIRAETVVIATGSAPVELPFLPFGGDVISSTEALALDAVPGRMVMVGGGYIGLELGTAFAKLGSQVTVVEAEERILPLYDAELTRPVAAGLGRIGVRVLTGTKARAFAPGAGITVETPRGTETIPADKVLVTVGRRPVTEGWGLEELSLTMAGRFIAVDDACRTSMRGVHAIGDVTGEPMLAHRAMAQGEMVAEIVAGHRRVWDKRAIPAVCFTDPEVVSVGLLPDQAEDAVTGTFPFVANARSMTVEREDGFIRVVARRRDHLILGIQGVGAGIAELSAAFGLALEMGARLEDVAATIHAHPTQGEALQEASLRALGQALHI